MSARRRKIGFPLLAKELTELANRKRTYVVRFLYAAGLFLGGLIAIYGNVGFAGGDVRPEIGIGKDIFRSLVELQFWLILLFLPATASGALTIEKERDSLSLLLLTTMPPWSILLQKYLSRLMPMLSFLLLSFPLLAVAYSYGGVDTGEVIASILLLLLFAAEVCAVAVMCSAYCRTTPEALISTYGALFCLYLFWVTWPPRLLTFHVEHSRNTLSVVIPAFVSVGSVTVVSLVLARVFLQTRAFVPPRNVLLQAFQWLDGVFENMNTVTGGVVLVNDTNSLPEDDPVAWRETAKKSLGTFRYLFRVCTALELPILFAGATINISTVRTNNAMSGLLFVLWWIAAAMICVHASGVITAERSRQTLDALLAAPLSGADILRQKMAGVRRLIAVLWVPFGTIYAFQLWFRGFDFGYLIGSVATVAIFLPLISWMALAVGLRIRATMKAVLTSVGIVAAVSGLPFALARLVGAVWGWANNPLSEILVSFSPITIVGLLERRGLPLLLTLPVYGVLWWAVRRDCLRQADRLLHRVEDEEAVEQSDVPILTVADWEPTEAPVATADAV